MKHLLHKIHVNTLISATYILFSIVFISCNGHNTATPSDGDTVAAEVFAPHVQDTLIPINLNKITNLRFPKYKIIKETPIIPDTISLAMDEENVSGGNYSAILNFDTIPSKTFYASIDEIAKTDSCWSINKFAYTYKRKDHKGGLYTISFSKGSMQILVTHINADLVVPEKKIEEPKKKKRK